ncbi:MAG: excinuclease ABC subunit UvrC [bacterium]|nr:excinuclease ABC subunit UvrC [bacterium]
MPRPPVKLSTIPKNPGVYLYKDSSGQVLYVGKAKDLRNRVSSYWHKSAQLEAAKQIMLEKITGLDYIMVDSETEALFLETTLIKKHHPPYNVIMKDDKYFSYIKINLREEYPSVTITRRIVKDGSRHFGPYPSTKAVRDTLKHLKKIFPFKTCLNPPDKPCFDYRIHRCAGHDTGPKSRTEYRFTIESFVHFLEGHADEVLSDLNNRMDEMSRQQNFEMAAVYRDRISAIRRMLERQKVILTHTDNLDFISLARQDGLSAINLFVFREGKLINKKSFILKNASDQSDRELTASFIEQYYTQSTDHPKYVILGQLPNRPDEIQKLLQLKIVTAQRGQKAQLLKLGSANALDALSKTKASWESDADKGKEAVRELKKRLHFTQPLHRVETYDISNIQGTSPVGSMVVFEDGLPKKSDYRKFKIKTVIGSNDPAMLAEMLTRRFEHTATGSKTEWPRPDLVILDGGKGQLSVVTKQLAKKEVSIPIVALAKRLEEIYFPDKPNPIVLPANSPALFLVQRMRDEAHRFAIGFYRQTHRKKSVGSQIDMIPGVGPKTKKKLIKQFGSVEGVRRADEQKLIETVGAKTAKAIRDALG